MFLAAHDQFFSRAGRCFPDLLLRAFEALLVVGIHAKVLPAVAVEVLGGTGLAAHAAATVVRTISIGVARTGALTLRRVISVTLSLFAGRRRRRGRGLRAANVPRANDRLVGSGAAYRPRRRRRRGEYCRWPFFCIVLRRLFWKAVSCALDLGSSF